MRSSRPTVLAEPSAASTSWYLSEDDPELRTRTGAVIASPRCAEGRPQDWLRAPRRVGGRPRKDAVRRTPRSEEHTSELQSLMRNSYAVFCLKKKKNYTE